MSMTGDDFTPPEFPSGTTQDAYDGPPGVPLGAAAGILAGVAALGVVAVLALGGSSKAPSSTLVAQPSVSVGIPGNTPTAAPTGGSVTSATPQASSGASGAGGAGGATGAPGYATATEGNSTGFSVGDCVDTSGSGSDFVVTDATCSSANYKIIYAFQNESGDIDTDMAQCYTINGNDSEFENGDSGGGYTLYCLNSLQGDYSPRRAAVDNCLDSTATYEVDCTSTRATWIVVGRINGTTDTKGCTKFGSYDSSYFWPASPPFVLCVDKYKH